MTPTPAARRSARVAAVFDGVADVYDNVAVPWFRPIAGHLVRQLAPLPGERALDIGCGRGAALFPLADAVGPTGRVTGIDLAPRMVAATGADAVARGLSTVDVQVMDAGTPRLPAAHYDVVAASFVLFFLPAPVAALRAWRELLVPGGRLGISTFATSEGGCLAEVFLPFLPPTAFPAGSPFDTDDGVTELVRTAGFDAVRTSGFELEVDFAGVEQWRAWSMSHGQCAVWARIPAAEHRRVFVAAAERLASARGADGRIRLTHRIRITLAERGRGD